MQCELEWRFDNDHEIICHEHYNDDEACCICDRWIDHYRFENGKDGSLEKAIEARDGWFRETVLASLKSSVAHQELAAAKSQASQVRKELSDERFNANRLREELENAKKALDVRRHENAALHQESLQLERRGEDSIAEWQVFATKSYIDRQEMLVKDFQKAHNGDRRKLEDVLRELEGARSKV